MISRSSAISFASVFWRGFAGRELHAGWGADEAATDMEASVPTPAAVDPSRQPAVLRRGEFAVVLFRICRMDSDASPPLAARVSALLSAPLLSAPLLSAPLLSGWGADEAATDMEASVPTPAAVDPSRQPAVLRRCEFAVALFRICRMDSDASPPLAALSAPLLSALLLSALLLLLRQSACACSVSGVTASTSMDGDGGMDVEDGDSDAGASEIVCSPGSGRMRSGLICQHV